MNGVSPPKVEKWDALINEFCIVQVQLQVSGDGEVANGVILQSNKVVSLVLHTPT